MTQRDRAASENKKEAHLGCASPGKFFPLLVVFGLERFSARNQHFKNVLLLFVTFHSLVLKEMFKQYLIHNC